MSRWTKEEARMRLEALQAACASLALDVEAAHRELERVTAAEDIDAAEVYAAMGRAAAIARTKLDEARLWVGALAEFVP